MQPPMSLTAVIPCALIQSGISALVTDTFIPQNMVASSMQAFPAKKFLVLCCDVEPLSMLLLSIPDRFLMKGTEAHLSPVP